MNSIRQLFVIAVVLSCTLSHAQDFLWHDKDGKTVPDNDHQKTRDGFGAMMLFTDDEKVFENWQKPEQPKIRNISTAQRGVPVHVLLIFASPGRDAEGKSNVTYDAKALKPDGSVYSEFKDLVALKGAGPPSGYLQLSPAAMAIRIEPEDPAGSYTVEIVVRDNVRKVELKLKDKFTVEVHNTDPELEQMIWDVEHL